MRESSTRSTERIRDLKNRMREIRSCGSVGEPVGNHRLYPEGAELPVVVVVPLLWRAVRARNIF